MKNQFKELLSRIYFDGRDSLLWQELNKLQFIENECVHWPENCDILLMTGHPKSAFIPYPDELINKPAGGSESVLLLMAQELANRGKKVVLAAPFAEPKVFNNLHCLPILEAIPFLHYRKVPACIVSRFYHPFIHNPCNALRKFFWLHDIVVSEMKPVYQVIQRKFDQFWVLSDYQKKEYLEKVALPENQIWKTTNVINDSLFSVRKPWSSRLQRQIIYTSRPSRGLDVALDVYEELLREFAGLKFVVCTYSNSANPLEDPELISLRPRLDKLPGVQVRSVGKKELVKLLSESAAMLYPNTSLLETSCLAVIESMAAGTPVITTSRGALSETVCNGESGIVVPWHDDRAQITSDLAAETSRVLLDHNHWEALSSQGHMQAFKEHGVHKIVSEWLEHLS